MTVPVLGKVKKHYEGTIEIIFIDVHEDPDFKKSYA